MRAIHFIYKQLLPFFCLLLVTCSNRGQVHTRCIFWVEENSFDETLIASAKKYRQVELEEGPAFIISPLASADNPQQINKAIHAKKQLHLAVYHVDGFDYIFRKEIMIPKMGARWGNPVVESTKSSANLAERDPILFCDQTMRVNRWVHDKTIEQSRKRGPVQIGVGEKAHHVFTGIGSDYFWRSIFTYRIKQPVKRFSSVVAPLEGAAFFAVFNEEMLRFLSQLKLNYPEEYAVWLGKDHSHIQNLHWLSKSNIGELWQELYANDQFAKAKEWLEQLDLGRLKLVYQQYPQSILQEIRAEIETIEDAHVQKAELLKQLDARDESLLARMGETREAEKRILLANPLLDFESVLAVRRHKIPGNIKPMGQGPDPAGLPSNFQSLSMINRNIWDNAIVKFQLSSPNDHELVYLPDGNRFVGKVDLHYEGNKLLFSQPDKNLTFQVYELDLASGISRQVSRDIGGDVDHYDACYLPSEDIIFASTACYHGVPCVNGSSNVANLCRMKPDGSEMRMLCFDQDDNWHPSVLNNGKVLYTRWEYTDSPHFFTRILMTMNPDGTNQRSYYGSNSYWPNSVFFARAVPSDPGQVVGIVSGHHGTRRAGELHLFDPAKGRFETDGVVQQIPGRNKKVEPIITDRLVDEVWPKFLHPWPLSDEFFLVAGKMTPHDNWAIYLVDVFDNKTLISSDPYYHLTEPIPLISKPRPPVIPDKVDLETSEATVYIQDIYEGPGLSGIPRGAVKSLRLFEWHYAYRGTGGHIHVGIDGPWEPRRLLGTVPIYDDGSAHFTIPANTPIALQPLDDEGRAVQIMRSWFTAMPGEHLSCVGCHEDANQVAMPKPTMAARKAPLEIEPWYGPERNFGFLSEVQPVLDQNCVGCHNGETEIPDLRNRGKMSPLRNETFLFNSAYIALHPYVRRAGPENDYHLTIPMEYHAEQTELVQLLRKGHHGVELDQEAWQKLYAWIDLNVPDHGTWIEHTEKIEPFIERRMELREAYAGLLHNPETSPETVDQPVFKHPVGEKRPPAKQLKLPNWPFNSQEARKKQRLGSRLSMRIPMDQAKTIDLAYVPAGKFIMGKNIGDRDAFPAHTRTIDQGFFMAVGEITLEQFRLFNPNHKQGVINWTNKDQGARGYPMENPDQPVVRVSWEEAMAFCHWLSEKSGYAVSLPSEAEWEWACRAGTSTPMNYGDTNSNFEDYANLADGQLRRLARRDSPPWQLRIDEVNDRHLLPCPVKQYEPNAWGLYDMHGNVAEWTASRFEAYPGNQGVMDYEDHEKRVVRGGSWYDRPYRARSGYRLGYEQYQKPFNVGFRVIVRKK